MNPMKKKTVRVLFCVLFVAVLVSPLPQAMWRVQSRILGMLPRAKFRR